MPWADKVDEWRANEVTKAFMGEVEEDIAGLIAVLVQSDEPVKIYRLQGMIRALRGVVDMPSKDGIRDPEESKEQPNE